MTEVYNNKEWLEIKQILKDRKQGKYPALNKFKKKKEEKHETCKSQNQQL